MIESAVLQKKAVRIAPHVIDTILLACGLAMAYTIGFNQGWIWAKLVALVLYIVVGTVAIKRGKTPTTRGIAALAAVVIFFYIVGVALTRNAWSWLA
ncbi:SirB2 family protein [Neopusillimonas aromaticivorans]|uniref:SirB2 family protein n=1 Tax=Neopusillimonas aromaticivorans TaxID=2979868 RepID=UPI0033163638